MVFLHRASASWIVSGIAAGDLQVEQEVLLNENGSPVNYIVVHQGLPSDMYDASCDGTWLLRKDIYGNRQWHSSYVNDYANSTIHSYLNGTFLNLFDADIREVIKQVKIPYVNGDGDSPVASGSSGLSCKIFPLSGCEVGFSTSDNQHFPQDGAKLSYFKAGTGSSANNKRIAKRNEAASGWALRSPFASGPVNVWSVAYDGTLYSNGCTNSYGIRPTLVLPYDFRFSESEVA